LTKHTTSIGVIILSKTATKTTGLIIVIGAKSKTSGLVVGVIIIRAPGIIS
jgi:hypothetical protein